MLIDIHTHFFPENIALQSIQRLENLSGVKAFGKGDLASLREYMKADGVDISVNMPVATKPGQVKGINRRMAAHNADPVNNDVICFGGMHPFFNMIGDFEEEILFLKENGIKGIKLHPEYQSFLPDDGKIKRLYESCIRHEMVVLFHAGADCAYDEDDVKGTPKRFCNLHEQFPELKMILAHMGGYRLWEDVYRFLIGKNVYLDTAYTMEMENSALANLIKDHGADKILFGSDFPWERPSAIKGKIEECIKDETVRENIFHRNAEKLIGLDKK